MQIGFVTEPIRVERPSCKNDSLLCFDSGRSISFADGQRHIGVFGTSGGGKSTQVIIPVIRSAIKSGATVVVIDPKGTLGSYVRGLAQSFGRQNDIIEYGTSPCATRINLIEGMSSSEFFDFIMMLICRFCDNKSGNMDFAASSAAATRDIYILLTELAKMLSKDNKTGVAKNRSHFSCTLPLILEIMDDPPAASKIFQDYANIAKNTRENRRFIKRVKNSPFHILNQEEEEYDSETLRQVSYNSMHAKQAIKAFLEEEKIASNFCHPHAHGLKIGKIEGKIPLLRFGAGAGNSAAIICRKVIESIYAWVYRQNVGGKPKYIIIDEFQEVADLSGNRLSDTSFLALAREFRCGVCVATQSYSGLAASNSVAGLEAFMANLNNKIFLHSEDPMTRAAAEALGSPDLISLNREAFSATFDTSTRNFTYGIDSLNNAFNTAMAITPLEGKPIKSEVREQTIEDVENAMKLLLEAKRKIILSDKGNESKTESSAAEQINRNITINDSDEMIDHDQDLFYLPDEEDQKAIPLEMEDSAEIDETTINGNPINILYSRFFAQKAEVLLPTGWLNFVADVLDLYSKLNLNIKIERLGLSHSCDLCAHGSPSEHIRYLNKLLSLSNRVCIKCGAPVGKGINNLCYRCGKNLPRREDDNEEERQFTKQV